MEQKIDYLKKYTLSKTKDVCIIPFDKVGGVDTNAIPQSWFTIFEESDIKKRIALMLDVWKNYSQSILSNTIAYLTEYLDNVELMCINGRYAVLYSVKSRNSTSEIYYYEGGNPLETFHNEVLKKSWDRIPISIREFYENVHNGFYYYASKAMGLVSLNDVTYFNDDDIEWGIIEDLKEPIGINLKTTFGFFENGLGDYIAIDYENCNNDNATLWFHNKQPKYNLNFWDLADEWIVIGFTN